MEALGRGRWTDACLQPNEKSAISHQLVAYTVKLSKRICFRILILMTADLVSVCRHEAN